MKQKAPPFNVFGNKERLQLICCLKKPKSVSDLLTKCTLSQSSLSQHLRVLKHAGIVTCARDGKQQIYSVHSKRALSIAQSILAM